MAILRKQMRSGLWPSAQATASQLLLHAAWQLYSWHVYHTQSILAKTLSKQDSAVESAN